MANGAAALSLVFEPAPESKGAPADEPIASEIGSAVADAVHAFGVALAEGGSPMRVETRALNGERLAAVVELWLAHREIDDFRGLAQREGVQALRARHGEALRQLLGADCSEAAVAKTFDDLCNLVVGVAGQVAAVEAAFRMN